MAEGSAHLHEDPAELSPDVKDRHRALVSLMEELEAIDWYGQRSEATVDTELAGILRHNREEEIEHAVMLIEWLRRHDASVDGHLRRYLFREEPILETEEDGGSPPVAPGTLGLGAIDGKEAL
jgi:uncharacterized protein